MVTVGAVVSMVKVDTVDDTESLPARSVNTVEMLHVPSVNPVNEHEPLEATTVV